MGELSSSIDEYETDGDRDTEVSENKSERNTPTQGKRRVSLANKSMSFPSILSDQIYIHVHL